MNIQSETNQKLATGAILGVFGSILRSILAYGYALSISRLGGATIFGAYTIIFSFVFVLVFVGEAGTTLGAIRFISIAVEANDRERIKGIIISAIKLVLRFSFFAAVLFSFSASLLTQYYQGGNDFYWSIIIFAWSLPFVTLNNLFISSAQGFKSINEKVISRDIIQPVVEFGTAITLFLLFSEQVVWLATAYLISVIIACSFSFFALSRRIPYLTQRAFPFENITRSIFEFSIFLMISRLTSIIAFRSGVFILGIWFSKEITGYFGAAVQTAQLLPLLLVAFSAMLGPFIAEAIKGGQIEELKRLYKFSTRWIVSLTLPLIVVIILGANHILDFFGPGYEQASLALIILAGAQFINLAVGATDTIIIMGGRSKLDMLNNIGLLIVTVVTGVLIIPRYGLVGSAITQGFAIVFINILKFSQIYFFYGLLPFSRSLAKYVSVILAVGLIVYYASNAIVFSGNLLPLLFIGVSVFFGYLSTILIIGLDPEDRMVIQNIVERFQLNQKARV